MDLLGHFAACGVCDLARSWCWGGEHAIWHLLSFQNDPRESTMDHTGMEEGSAHSHPDACSSPGTCFVPWVTQSRFRVGHRCVISLHPSYSCPLSCALQSCRCRQSLGELHGTHGAQSCSWSSRSMRGPWLGLVSKRRTRQHPLQEVLILLVPGA